MQKDRISDDNVSAELHLAKRHLVRRKLGLATEEDLAMQDY